MIKWIIYGLLIIALTVPALAIARMNRRIRRLVATNNRLREMNSKLRSELFAAGRLGGDSVE